MGAVKLLCCGAALLVAAGQIAALPSERRQTLMSAIGLLIGGQPAPNTPARSFAALPVPQPSAASISSGYQTETIDPDGGGQFETTVDIEGQRLPVLVDTGATYMILSFEDAARLGLRPMPSDFKYKTWTANGSAMNAMAELREVRLGSIEVRDVPVLIAARGSMSHNLLGMTFLTKLHGFRVDGGRLVLQQ